MRQRNLLRFLSAALASFGLWFLIVSVVTSVTVVTSDSAVAQDDDDDAGDDDAGDDDDDGGDGAAGDDDDDDSETSTGGPTDLLAWTFEALGITYSLVFLAMSFTLVALIVMNLLTARRDSVCPMHLVEMFEQHLNEKRFQEAYDLAKNDDSVLGQILSAGMAKLSTGYAQAIEAMQEVGEEENMKMEHRLSYIQLIGTISPMVGLFGTVQGMISSFQIIAIGGQKPEPAELAKGISTALFTTLVGLAIAIPAIAAFSILRNRISRLVLEVGIMSEGLMNRFEKMSK